MNKIEIINQWDINRIFQMLKQGNIRGKTQMELIDQVCKRNEEVVPVVEDDDYDKMDDSTIPN